MSFFKYFVEENLNKFKKTHEQHSSNQTKNNFNEHLKLNENLKPFCMYSSFDDEQETIFSNEESQNMVERRLKECPSSINLEDICGDNSYKEHIWNERRVFRSSDGK